MVKSKGGLFSIKAFYSCLELEREGTFSINLVWNSWVLTKVGFFIWEVVWGKILTLDLLKRRGWILADQCNLCKVGELADHVFFPCAIMKILWHLLCLLYKVEWMLPSMI